MHITVLIEVFLHFTRLHNETIEDIRLYRQRCTCGVPERWWIDPNPERGLQIATCISMERSNCNWIGRLVH